MTDVVLLVRVAEDDAAAAVAAVFPFAKAPPECLVAHPTLDPEAAFLDHVEAGDLDARAREIAEAVRPRGNQKMRRDALEAALWGYDSFHGTEGEGDASMRVALGALSKALRPFAMSYASPIDIIANRYRDYEPSTGGYRGTIYKPTKLGLAVRAILIENGDVRDYSKPKS